jgi:hypothetical protein
MKEQRPEQSQQHNDETVARLGDVIRELSDAPEDFMEQGQQDIETRERQSAARAEAEEARLAEIAHIEADLAIWQGISDEAPLPAAREHARGMLDDLFLRLSELKKQGRKE